MEHLSTEVILLIGFAVLFFALFWERLTKKFEIPVLLLFLVLGILVGDESIGNVKFDSHSIAFLIGASSLVIILFSGGMNAKFKEIKHILLPSTLLATVGVLLTTVIAGLFIYWLIRTFFITHELSIFESLLLASVITTTDFALVFSILHSKGLRLKHRLGNLLEFESGSNDVMAFLLLTTFLRIVIDTHSTTIVFIVLEFFKELGIGFFLGFLLGRFSVKIINRVNMSHTALYPIFLLSIAFIIYFSTILLSGSGFLAVYIGGLTIGNSKFIHRKTSIDFFDGFAWLTQIFMFFIFGILINPAELISLISIGLIIGLFMIFFARPISVFPCILPFKKIPMNAKFYVSWVGLRGAVPLIFATYILEYYGGEVARFMFNIVFFVMFVSLLLQGTTVSFMAKLLKLDECNKSEKQKLDEELHEDTKLTKTNIKIEKRHLKKGNTLMDLELPESTAAIVVKRENHYFVPKGSTIMEEGDILSVISDDKKTLQETYENMEIKHRYKY